MSTSTLLPAQSATYLAGTPALNHVDRQACRRSYGRLANGEAYSSVLSASLRARGLRSSLAPLVNYSAVR